MENSISYRFELLIKKLGLNKNSFSQAIGLSNNVTIGRIINENRKPSFEILEKIIQTFGSINANWLLTGDGEMFIGEVKNIIPLIKEPEEPYITKQYESEPEKLIPITDINAAAGSGWFNGDNISTIDQIKLPAHLLKGGTYLAVRIKGDSMSPTLQDGGFLIIRLLDRTEWPHMPNEHVFVICDREGKTFAKRVKNRYLKGFYVLMSDNPDKASYPNFNLQLEEINTIWHAEWYLSARMPNIHDQYYSRLQRLEDDMDDIRKLLIK